uniref:Uncharacterized protein n=1 Tax=Anguilla anguilla TaxID=7936 RepID=A0A0E9U2P7_ANGAN
MMSYCNLVSLYWKAENSVGQVLPVHSMDEIVLFIVQQ